MCAPEQQPADTLEVRKLEFLRKVRENLAINDPVGEDRFVSSSRCGIVPV